MTRSRRLWPFPGQGPVPFAGHGEISVAAPRQRARKNQKLPLR